MVFYNSMHKNSFFNNHKIRFKNNNLRFLEFTKVWKSTKIGEIADIVGGGTPRTEVEEYWDGEIKWFTPSEIGKTKYIFDSKRHITDKGLKNSSAKLLPKDTILLSSRATVGEISIALTECSTNQGFQSLITKNNVDNDFIYYLISTIKNEFLRRSSGSTFLEISKNEIKRIPINIPELSEQNKISNLFSAIDNKIEMLEKKHQYYQDFKKYLMQRIFSSQDDKLRFDNSSKIQKEIQLSDVISIINKRNKNDENIPVLSISNKFGFISQTEQFEDREVASSDKKNYKIVNKGEFAYNPARINVGSIAQLKNYEKGIISPMYIVFKVDSNVLNQTYFENFLDSDYFRYEMMKRLEGSVRMILSADSLKNIKITIPSIDEQEKLSKVFLAFDKKIKITKYQLDKTQEFKKGLLQQMFVVQLILSLLQNKKHI